MGRYLEAAKVLRAAMDAAAAALTDEQALKAAALYPLWDGGAQYDAGERVRFGGALYKCVQAHAAQPDWTPTAAPSLWAKVLVSDTGEALPWEQPESTNPYMKGDKVTHGGKTWVSTIDNNVWEPGVYGWEETGG
ncbi:carbohydrate-binding protein [Anaerotruncus massiliensis (ex Liu et al. 2021)]|uniref:carbohydrate-binding protein n=1 Tax=Anaerotruncus massiliensis (ex Liu et al. 2021) TaxID=2321404 RepID=UPI003AB2455A